MAHSDALLPELAFFDGQPLPDELVQIRKCKLEATAALLGDTISISDEQWQSPSRLPGWTRAHVAAHLARNADAYSQVLEGLLAGEKPRIYASPTERRWSIERDSMRSGLELQIDLDTSFGRLNSRLSALMNQAADFDEATMRRVRIIPLARLNETVLHRVDLDIGFEVEDIYEPLASWLLNWNAARAAQGQGEPLELRSESGASNQVRSTAANGQLTGSSAQLLGWLTGRLRPEVAEQLDFPTPPAAI